MISQGFTHEGSFLLNLDHGISTGEARLFFKHTSGLGKGGRNEMGLLNMRVQSGNPGEGAGRQTDAINLHFGSWWLRLQRTTQGREVPLGGHA